MIISRTPLRISLAGGGSDLPAFWKREGGAVTSTTINKYIYITVNPKFDNKIRASYSRTEIVDTVDELQHELIREALRLLGITGGIEITSISDIPSQGSGLGSSSSYTVGLLNALYTYLGKHAGAKRLASEACRIEIELCNKPIGKQDQYIGAFGGLQHIQFNPDGSVFVDPVICKPETKRKLDEHLLLLYTGITRAADGILAEQQDNLSQENNRRITRRMVNIARELRDALTADDFMAVGELLHAGWVEKRKLALGITNSRIDAWYETARALGALGGKITGAGGRGFLLLFAPPERHGDIIAALPELRPVPFALEPQGSKIIYIE
jgi:D-glycero-alpha-D-manno-heptose-7-phosphate kinase